MAETTVTINEYECMVILDSNRYARDPSGVSGQVAQAVEKVGGEVLASRLWNEQKLAYPINGQRKGTYWLTYFRCSSDKLGQVERSLRLNDNVLRSLTLKVDPRLVEMLVSHVRGQATPVEGDAEKAAAEKAAAEKVAAEKAVAEKSAATEAATEAGDAAPASK